MLFRSERYLGFISELIRKGLPVSEENICWFGTSEKADLLAGKPDWLDRFVENRLASCTAAVCYNDEIAYSLVRRLLKAGRRIPEDTAVVSFDNSHLCSLSPVPLTSLAHERHKLGSSAAEALLKLFRQKPASGACFPWSLHERRSG